MMSALTTLRCLGFVLLLSLSLASKDAAGFTRPFYRKSRRSEFSVLLATTSSTTTTTLSRAEAAERIQQDLLPQSEYGARISMGKDELFGDPSSNDNVHDSNAVALQPDDPLLSFSYGEFPLSSLDIALDQAMDILSSTSTNPLQVVDLGSGCGRPCLYMALTRTNWHVHGIEVSEVFHQQALQAQKRAVELQLLEECQQESSSSVSRSSSSRLQLHQGLAEDFPHVLSQAEVIFCYATAFETAKTATGDALFRPDIAAMILAPAWTNLLTQHCRPGCLVITTDRALDPDAGWKLLHRIDSVPNPEVMDSTVFIQQKIMPS